MLTPPVRPSGGTRNPLEIPAVDARAGAPEVTRARQVAQTPALQAKGAGSPLTRALSRMLLPSKATLRGVRVRRIDAAI